jgi:2-keto-4-pentenoate hydratase/2-oxohepta-3-ene-1,7-dioic acid hydratase in catechol pathway
MIEATQLQIFGFRMGESNGRQMVSGGTRRTGSLAWARGDNLEIIEGEPWGGDHRSAGFARLDAVRLLPPVAPVNFYALGLNYPEHIRWGREHFKFNFPRPRVPHVGQQVPASIIAAGETIVLPAAPKGSFEYEGELVAVIGRKAKAVPEAELSAM